MVEKYSTHECSSRPCVLYIHVSMSECVSPPLSPALKMRSVARIRCACGDSVQSMPPQEQRELSVRVRVTAGRTSAVPFNEVSFNSDVSDRNPDPQVKSGWLRSN